MTPHRIFQLFSVSNATSQVRVTISYMSVIGHCCRCCSASIGRVAGSSTSNRTFSTFTPSSDETTTTKLPSRDWSKYAPPPLPSRSSGPSSSTRSGPYPPRRERDRERAPKPPREAQHGFGLGGVTGERKLGPGRTELYPASGAESRRRPEGISKWVVRRDTRAGDDALPKPSAFGLKRSDQLGDRGSWADRGRADLTPIGSPRDAGPSQPGLRPGTNDRVGQRNAVKHDGVDSEQKGALVEPLNFDDDTSVSDELTSRDRRRTPSGQRSRGGDRLRRLQLDETEEHALPARGGRSASNEIVPERRRKEKVKVVPEQRAEKEVFIPSTIAVERLAAIFNVKLCMSIVPLNPDEAHQFLQSISRRE